MLSTDPVPEGIEALCDQVRYLDAWEQLGRPAADGALRRWSSLPWRLLGARLAVAWGAARLAERLRWRAWRMAPQNGDAAFQRAVSVLRYRGPLRALDAIDAIDSAINANAWSLEHRADLIGLRAWSLCLLRDFEAADHALRTALDLVADNTWLRNCQARLAWDNGKRDQALELLSRGVADWPHSRALSLTLAEHWIDLGQRQQARELLNERAARWQCRDVLAQLLMLAVEDGDAECAISLHARFLQAAPWAGTMARGFAAAQLARLHLNRGEREAALEHARMAADGSPFWSRTAQRLEQADRPGVPLLLPVPVVRQHFATCAPATLSALTQYWGKGVDQDSIAAQICHGGTFAEQERAWAQDAGWQVHEFRADPEVSAALIGHHLPFAVESKALDSAHLQAIIGHDPASGHFVIREPSSGLASYTDAEFFGDGTLAHGPRAMLLLPAGHALPADLVLPEAQAYDLYFQLMCALRANDRDSAGRAAQALHGLQDGRRLAIYAEWELAAYDGDQAACLRQIDQLRALYPEDELLAWRRLQTSEGLEPSMQREEALQALLERRVSASIRVALTQVYCIDARRLAQAERQLRLAEREAPAHHGVLSAMASLAEQRQDFERAHLLHRYASMAAPTSSNLAWNCLRSALAVQRTDAALDWLRRRDHASRPRSREPALTLCSALEWTGDDDGARSLLHELYQQHGDDPAVAERYASTLLWGERHREGLDLLRGLSGRSHEGSLLRLQADAHSWAGEHAQALELLRQRLKVESTAMDLHSRLASALADLHGTDAVCQHFRAAIAQFPYAVGLYRMAIDWLPEGAAEDERELLTDLLAVHPDNAWGWRQLAFLSLRLDQLAAAQAAAAQAKALEPQATALENLLGDLALREGNSTVAMTCFQRAVQNDADAGYAADRMLGLTHEPSEWTALLALQLDALTRLAHSGAPLLEWIERGLRHLPAATLQHQLQERAERLRRFWQFDAASIQCLRRYDLSAALALSASAIERWPEQAMVWLERALTLRSAHDPTAVDATQRAMALNQDWDRAAQLQSELLADQGQLAAACELIRARIARNPRNATNHGYLGDLLHRCRDTDGAARSFMDSLKCNPSYHYGWDRLAELAPERALALAEEHVHDSPGSARAWLRLARGRRAKSLAKALDACDRCLTLQPGLIEAQELRMSLLAETGLVEQALALASPEQWNGRIPIALRQRAVRLHSQYSSKEHALQQLHQAVADHPDSTALRWAQLDVGHKLEADAEIDQALLHLRQLEPRSAAVLRASAQRAESQGNHVAALKARQQLVQIEPEDLGSWYQLVELAIESKNWPLASKRLLEAGKRCPHPWLTVQAIRIHGAEGDSERSAREFSRLIRDPEASPHMVARALENHPERQALVGATLDLLEDPPNSAAAVSLMVEECWHELAPKLPQLIKRLHQEQPGALCIALVGEYLCRLANRSRAPVLGQLLRQQRAALTRHTPVWGKLCYAAGEALGRAQVREIGADWQQREQLEGWMLHNLARAYVEGGQRDVAIAIRRHALDQCSDFRGPNAVWLAVDLALTGTAERAEIHELRRWSGHETELEPDSAPYTRNAHAWLEIWESETLTTDQTLNALGRLRSAQVNASNDALFLRHYLEPLRRRLLGRLWGAEYFFARLYSSRLWLQLWHRS